MHTCELLFNPKQAGLFANWYPTKLLKMLISAFFEHSFHEKRAFKINVITSVPDIFQFCFLLQQANMLQFIVLNEICASVNFLHH